MADPSSVLAADALLGLLLPFWQIVIGGSVLVAVLVSVRRLARRGPSRMTTALIVTGGAVIFLAVVGLLFQGR
jgi:predicted permease